MTKIRSMFSWRVAPILEDAMHSVLLDIASALPWKLLSSFFALIGNFALSSLSNKSLSCRHMGFMGFYPSRCTKTASIYIWQLSRIRRKAPKVHFSD